LEQIQPDKASIPPKNSSERKANAFKTLIATILSVRTKDETTFKVTEKLWQHYSTPKMIAEAPLDQLEQLIKSSGTYHQKALRIKEVGKIIHEQYNDEVPTDINKLLALPGVGRKVANCVRVISFGISAIPVDTHVHRISNRLGWVKTNKPEETEKTLELLFPSEFWTIINYTMVSFGKTICRPINPLCTACPVNNRCPKLIQFTSRKKNIPPSKKTRQKAERIK
jgi:endonuclease-3